MYILITPGSVKGFKLGKTFNDQGFDSPYNIKGPCSPKRLCTLVFLFWNVDLLNAGLIGCYFPSDSFQLREIPAMHSG